MISQHNTETRQLWQPETQDLGSLVFPDPTLAATPPDVSQAQLAADTALQLLNSFDAVTGITKVEGQFAVGVLFQSLPQGAESRQKLQTLMNEHTAIDGVAVQYAYCGPAHAQ